MRIRSLALIVPVVLVAPALAAAQPSATGETGLFTVPSTGTLARRAWSFGLYYNNRDRVVDLDDAPHKLVAEDDRRGQRQAAVHGGKVGVAHPAGSDVDDDVVGTGLDGIEVLDLERLVLSDENGCLHDPLL